MLQCLSSSVQCVAVFITACSVLQCLSSSAQCVAVFAIVSLVLSQWSPLYSNITVDLHGGEDP